MDITQIGNMMLGGVISEFAPTVLKGMLVELLKQVTVAEASEWVTNNYSLWDKISSEYQDKIYQNAPRLGDLSWFTADWLINALKDDKPALASLFASWKKGHNWLERQVEALKQEIGR